MYKLHLILKYLRKRRIAWVSLIAVMLCTAMVLVVISVMGGWLRMFRASFQGLSGDVVVRSASRTGFPFYEEMIAEAEKLGEVEAGVPLIETFGLVNIDNQIRDGVRVVGVPLEKIGQVNGFWGSLYLKNPEISPAEPLAEMEQNVNRVRDNELERLQHQVEQGILTQAEAQMLGESLNERSEQLLSAVRQWADRQRSDPAARPDFDLPFAPEFYRLKLDTGRRTENAPDAATYPGMIVGTGLIGIRKDVDGEMDRWTGLEPTNPRWVKFLTLSLRNDSNIDIQADKAEKTFWIVDNSRTGVFETDDRSVYVDFALLQNEVDMNPQPLYGFDPETFEPTDEVTGYEPARTNEIHFKLADGIDIEAGRQAVEAVVRAVLSRNDADPLLQVRVETWEDRYRPFLNAVEKEKALVTVLFSFISVVAIFLIFCIFYMIVAEKTKDIGIVKSVGATSGGIALIFLGYGAAIGIVGGGLGVLVGGLIVYFINEIHTAMNYLLGIEIWSAQTYMFDHIPNTMNPNEVLVIVAVAVLSSILGAVVPAWRAARLKPVEALRFE